MNERPTGPLVLVTRPIEEAQRTAEALAEHNYRALIEPLLEIMPLPDAGERLAAAGRAAALLCTSANGVRAYAAATTDRSLPVYAVGKLTGDAARAAGFAEVTVAGGDVEALADLVLHERRPEDGRLLHVAGEHVAGDLAGRLRQGGFEVEPVALYTATPAQALSPQIRDTLAQGNLSAALFFSPRTARTFVTLARTAEVEAYCRGCVAVCLSQAVADALAGLEWRQVVVSAAPGIGPMIDALMPAVPAQGGHGTGNAKGDPGMTEGNGQQPTLAIEAGQVIKRFGGIRPMAAKLGISFSTVQGWKERDHIPPARHAQIIELAAQHGISLAPEAGQIETSPPESATPATEAARSDSPPTFGQSEPGVTDKPPPIPPPLIHNAPPPPLGGSGIGAFGAFVISLLVVGAALAGVWFTRDSWQGGGTAASDTAVLDDLARRTAKLERDLIARPPATSSPGIAQADPKLAQDVAALDKRVGDLQAALDGSRDAARDGARREVAPVADQAKALAQRLDTLEKGTDPQAFILVRNSLNDLAGKLDTLAKRLETAEKSASAVRSQGMAEVALALSVAQLRRAIDSGKPFTGELIACRASSGGDSTVFVSTTALQPFAASGVASRASLIEAFPDTAADIMRASAPGEATSRLSQLRIWLSALVTIRPVGADAKGDSPAARLARAEALLARDDIAGAAEQIGGLGAPASTAAKPWLDRANARLSAEAALATLEARAAQSLARK